MKIRAFDLYVYLIFMALIKMYFIPETVRQICKIAILFGFLFWVIKRLNKSEVINFSLVFSYCIILSGAYNYIIGYYTIKALLDSILYALSFYDLYTLFLYAKKYRCVERMKYDLYKINLLYCIFTIVSVAIVGTENNDNAAVYLFGNKFISSYLFISLVSLYGITHDLTSRRIQRRMFGFIVIGTLFSLYVGCATATVSLIFAALLYYADRVSHAHFFSRKAVVLAALMATAVVPVIIDQILKYRIVNYIIFDAFHKNASVYGRFRIYKEYLFGLLRNKFWLGYGYSNGKMMQVTGMFSNAQNGLLEQMMNFGMLGVLAIFLTVGHAFRKSPVRTSGMIILLYAMIIAAVFEITINWFFWIALFSMQWLEYAEDIR